MIILIIIGILVVLALVGAFITGVNNVQNHDNLKQLVQFEKERAIRESKQNGK